MIGHTRSHDRGHPQSSECCSQETFGPVYPTACSSTLGMDDVYTAPPQTGALSLRAAEEWKRCICENQVFSILFSVQRLHGFRQVVQHVQLHVANEVNWLINAYMASSSSGFGPPRRAAQAEVAQDRFHFFSRPRGEVGRASLLWC